MASLRWGEAGSWALRTVLQCVVVNHAACFAEVVALSCRFAIAVQIPQ